MAQAAAKAAGPAGFQEDAPVRRTRYTRDYFQPGLHVTVEHGPGGASSPYTGTVKAVNQKTGLVEVTLDDPSTVALGYIFSATPTRSVRSKIHRKKKGQKNRALW